MGSHRYVCMKGCLEIATGVVCVWGHAGSLGVIVPTAFWSGLAAGSGSSGGGALSGARCGGAVAHRSRQVAVLSTRGNLVPRPFSRAGAGGVAADCLDG